MSSTIYSTPPRRSLEGSLSEVKQLRNLRNERLSLLLGQLFKGNFWDKNMKNSVSNTPRGTINTEREELVEMTLSFQQFNGWFPWHTNKMIKVLASIGWLNRKGFVDKILSLTRLYQHSVPDIIDAAQITAGFLEWDRPKIVSAITSRAPASFSLKSVNIFLKIFGDLSEEKRRYYLENKLIEYTMTFITNHYLKEEIENIIQIIDKIPAQDRDDLMKRIIPWMKEVEGTRNRSRILEQLVYLMPEKRKEKLQNECKLSDWGLF